MHAAVSHGTPSLMSLPKDGVASCEVRPPRSSIRSLISLVLKYPKEDHCSFFTNACGTLASASLPVEISQQNLKILSSLCTENYYYQRE